MKNSSTPLLSHELQKLMATKSYREALEYIARQKEASHYPPSFWNSAERIIDYRIRLSESSHPRQPLPTHYRDQNHCHQEDPSQSPLWDEAWYIETYYDEYRPMITIFRRVGQEVIYPQHTS
jgi:hypothetical protein